jgi:D-aminopeptidase
VDELGEIETPIVLTNTLSVPRAAEALIDWTLLQPGNEEVRSVNPIAGETNDGVLNNIRKMAVTKDHVLQAITRASSGPVAEGCVGPGTGTVCFGWKGGIGTSSRLLPTKLGGYAIGALVQTNFGGVLQIDGIPVGKNLGEYYLKDDLENADGSILILLATDAPLSDRNLKRLAQRGLAGLARTGASMAIMSSRSLRLWMFAARPRDAANFGLILKCRTISCRLCSKRLSKRPKKRFIIPSAWQKQ